MEATAKNNLNVSSNERVTADKEEHFRNIGADDVLFEAAVDFEQMYDYLEWLSINEESGYDGY